jgi:hypothetical protein
VEYLHTNDDGSTIKYTEEMIKATILDASYNKEVINNLRPKLFNIRQEVYDFFNERYDTNDDEITCSVEDVNKLLESIGADQLKRLWTVSGRIEFTVTDIEADSEDDARDQVENNLSVEFDGNIVDDYSIEVNDIEQQ